MLERDWLVILGAVDLRDAILAALEPPSALAPTNCKHGKWGKAWMPDESGRIGWLVKRELFKPYKSKFCPDCGAALDDKGER